MNSKKLFDITGRRTTHGSMGEICNPDKDFIFIQPKLKTIKDYEKRYSFLIEATNIKNIGITNEIFKSETSRLLDLIKNNSKISNILNGVYLPLIIPKIDSKSDIGNLLEKYLEGVEKSYKKYNGGEFWNYRKGDLDNNVEVIDKSRQDKLIKKIRKESVVAIYFPGSMQGFSIDASREQIEFLPEEFILSGIETVIAMIMYPDVLACNYKSPGISLSPFSWKSPGYSLYFEAVADRFDFLSTGRLSIGRARYSTGISFMD